MISEIGRFLVDIWNRRDLEQWGYHVEDHSITSGHHMRNYCWSGPSIYGWKHNNEVPGGTIFFGIKLKLLTDTQSSLLTLFNYCCFLAYLCSVVTLVMYFNIPTLLPHCLMPTCLTHYNNIKHLTLLVTTLLKHYCILTVLYSATLHYSVTLETLWYIPMFMTYSCVWTASWLRTSLNILHFWGCCINYQYKLQYAETSVEPMDCDTSAALQLEKTWYNRNKRHIRVLYDCFKLLFCWIL